MKEYSLKSDFLRQLDRDVLDFVNRGLDNRDDEQFNRLALRMFTLQYHTLSQYRDYCRRTGITPETVTRWEEIPAASSFALKKILWESFPSEEAEQIYMSLGVVELKRKRRRIYPDRASVEVTNSANSLVAGSFLFPGIERIRILLMLPPPTMAQGMVMASGSEDMRRRFGTQDSRFLVSFRGLDLKALLGGLHSAEKTGEPLALIGPSADLFHFFSACEQQGIRFHLPEGSRVCDSSGYMGRYMGCPKEEYFRICSAMLGIKEDFCLNALWTCESSTVYFDNVLRNSILGRRQARRKESLPWSRTVAVDPRTFRRVPEGSPGLLRHYDLTNRSMAFAVQTDKLGYETGGGFEVTGRWNKALGRAEPDHSVPHPGGRMATRAKNFLMQRKLSRIREIYSCIS